MNIYEKLLNIQNELKAPKNQHNNFGNYDYRSAEDILEAAKPICQKNKALLSVEDEVVMIGSRYYVRATAMLIDIENVNEEGISGRFEVSAYAREEENKKGMDASQVTGATSSYARKYALNGLFCIDDTKDADTDAFKKQQDKTTSKPQIQQQPKLITQKQRERLVRIANGNNEVAKRILERHGYQKSEQIKMLDYDQICTEIESEILM